MVFRLRRFLRCLIFCTLGFWLFVTVIILQDDAQISKSVNLQLPDDVTRNKSIEFIGQTLEAIKFMRKLLDYQSNNETSHAVREQVVAPVIDDKKNEFDAPGEMGKGLEINRTKLLPVDIQKYDDGLEKNAFNVFASDLISTHRSLPDVRNEGCRKIKYKRLEVTASIVMCFYNEAWSVLLRSINSIIDRSPRYLLKEIILVDDFSDLEHLKQPLDDYIKSLRIVRLIRQKKREGLIRSRLTGAAAVKGDVIIFLDSHIEVTEGWLEPLLGPISQNRTTVVTPIIDTIDDMTLRYHFGTADLISVGGFNWNLQFTWHALPEREKKKRKHLVEPVRSPTMAGGLFAISKKYFNDLGTYDSGMDIWGGENLEISFRIWMCGGTLLIAPCSHVGHIFRKRFPYESVSVANIVKKNSIRVAEVWLDEYKKNYYERFNYDLGDYGDVTSRKLLRQRLQCKSFQWYLTEIYPELYVPNDAVAVGEIRNMAVSSCIDGSASPKNYHQSVVGYPCHNQGGNQYFLLNPKGEIRRDDGCLDYSGGIADVDQNGKVLVVQCHAENRSQQWIYDNNNQLYHPNSKLCMSLSEDRTHIRMQRCDQKNMRHKWLWKRKTTNNMSKAYR